MPESPVTGTIRRFSLPRLPSRPEMQRMLRLLLPPLLGVIVMLYLFYPGYMTSDSFWQIAQGRSGVYNDIHPPIMAWVWGWVDSVIPGAGGMLLLHNLLFWLALAYIVKVHTSTYRGYVILTLLIGFFPSILSQLSTVMQDEGMIASLLAALAAFMAYRRKNSLALLLVGIVFLFYGTAVRHNALPAALPIIWFGVSGVLERRGIRGWKLKTLAFLMASVVLYGATSLVNKGLTDEKAYIWQHLPMNDLTGISVRTGQVLLPEYMLQNYKGKSEKETLDILARKSAHVETWVLYTPTFGPLLVRTDDQKLLDDAYWTWLRVVANNPGAYLAHRTFVMAKLLGLTKYTGYPFFRTIYPNSLGFKFEPNGANLIVMQVLGGLSQSLFFRPWIYVLALILLWAGSFRLRGGAYNLPLVLSISGLLYVAPQYFISPGWQFRYTLWTVACAVISVGLLASLSAPLLHAAYGNLSERLRRRQY